MNVEKLRTATNRKEQSFDTFMIIRLFVESGLSTRLYSNFSKGSRRSNKKATKSSQYKMDNNAQTNSEQNTAKTNEERPISVQEVLDMDASGPFYVSRPRHALDGLAQG